MRREDSTAAGAVGQRPVVRRGCADFIVPLRGLSACAADWSTSSNLPKATDDHRTILDRSPRQPPPAGTRPRARRRAAGAVAPRRRALPLRRPALAAGRPGRRRADGSSGVGAAPRRRRRAGRCRRRPSSSAAIVVLVAVFAAGIGVGQSDSAASAGGGDGLGPASLPPEFATYTEAWKVLHDNFVDPSALDPHEARLRLDQRHGRGGRRHRPHPVPDPGTRSRTSTPR